MSEEQEDYLAFLEETGLTDEDVQGISDFDPVLFLAGDSFIVAGSAIHGLGMFATQRIRGGATIAPALLMGCKTIAGRFVNHSGKPNATYVAVDEENVKLVAHRAIEEGTEITVDYRRSIHNE